MHSERGWGGGCRSLGVPSYQREGSSPYSQSSLAVYLLQVSSLTVLKPWGPEGPAVCGSFPELILLDLLAAVDTVVPVDFVICGITLSPLSGPGLGALFSFCNILFPTPSSCSSQMQSTSPGGDSRISTSSMSAGAKFLILTHLPMCGPLGPVMQQSLPSVSAAA